MQTFEHAEYLTNDFDTNNSENSSLNNSMTAFSNHRDSLDPSNCSFDDSTTAFSNHRDSQGHGYPADVDAIFTSPQLGHRSQNNSDNHNIFRMIEINTNVPPNSFEMIPPAPATDHPTPILDWPQPLNRSTPVHSKISWDSTPFFIPPRVYIHEASAGKFVLQLFLTDLVLFLKLFF